MLWLVALVAITIGSTVAGNDYRNDFSLPGTESQELIDAYAEHAPEQEGDPVTVVVQAEGGVDAVADEVDALVDDLSGLDHVAAVQPPDPQSGTVSDDGTLGIITVVLDDQTGFVPTEDKKAIIETAQDHEADGIRIELTGDAVREVAESEAGGGGEGIGVLAALVILLFMFGSFLAASLPLITAVFAVGTTFGFVALVSHVATIPDYTPPILMLVGLGVGIDYALLVFARYRAELLGGADRERAARTALDTAGRSVLFAGATVVIALLGLYTLNLGSLEGVALVGDPHRADDDARLAGAAAVAADALRQPAGEADPQACREAEVRAGAALAEVGRPGPGASVGRAGRGRGGAGGALRAGSLDAARARRRRQRPPEHHQPAGLRPDRRGLRSRRQRAARGRDRGRPRRSPRTPSTP